MIQTKHQLFGLGIALGLGVAAVGLPQAAFAWEPKKPVDFIVMAGKGGGADKAVRKMQAIIAKNKLAPVPFTPLNKPGGSGAEALVYMKGKKGDNHTIMFTLNSFYTTPLRQPALGVNATLADCIHSGIGIHSTKYHIGPLKRPNPVAPCGWRT